MMVVALVVCALALVMFGAHLGVIMLLMGLDPDQPSRLLRWWTGLFLDDSGEDYPQDS
jgi:hypothetical protein